MKRELVEFVRQRAGGRCEYCHLPQDLVPAPFHLDHIIAEQHGGKTTPENLAFACMRCNKTKGPNIASLDPDSSALTRLFNPRTDEWNDHFILQGSRLRGKTAQGRATVRLLGMNDRTRMLLREELMREGPL